MAEYNEVMEKLNYLDDTKLHIKNAIMEKGQEITDLDTFRDYVAKILDIDSLPKCKDISVVQGGYETLWTSVFVKPLAWVIVNIGKIINSYGLSIILVTILIKLILFPFTNNSLKKRL